MQLSKSEYMMFLKHPALAWLKKHDKSKIPEIDANLQALFDEGFEFEKYANQRFKDAVEVGFNDFSEYKSMPERTRKVIEDGAKTVLQGRFETEHITCICDVVDIVDDKTLDLYEIKSSTKVKPDHIYDLAFQYVVLETAGYKVRNINLIYVNRDYVRDGEVDPTNLSAEEDITDQVMDKVEGTKKKIKEALQVIHSTKMPDPSPRHVNLGFFNDWMEVYKNLKNVDKYSIYNLIAPGAKRIRDLEDAEIEKIEDIPYDFKLTPKQLAQVKATKEDRRIINEDLIETFLDSLEYPLYFLDYETAMSVVPLYDGTRPYQQIPFQYSLHTVEEADSEPVHTEYLHVKSSNPVPELLKSLKNDIGPKGSVIVWYKHFETKRNEEMGDAFPEYKEFLDDINDRVVDLMEPFNNGWFVDKDFMGSASIKNVLPVLAPDLSYKKLNVQEGGAAQRLWMSEIFREEDNQDKEELIKNLIEYCKLDTYAMVRIWQELMKI
ncbi:MAG: DUF2779 domain-containing protein [Candidatus Paceibacterota bacterium]